MANFVHLLIGVISALTFISLISVNSSPTDVTSSANVPIVKVVEVITKHECYNDLDCGHGKCSNETGNCGCNRGWTTYSNITDKTGYCNYDQCSKQTAFFFSFFAGVFGADWFYLSRSNLGYIISGILKLLLGCGCCGAWSLTYFGPEIQNSESVKAKLRGVSICFSLLAFAWWIVDWARILNNRFPDGNGVGLFPS
jgi:hypothetical protein